MEDKKEKLELKYTMEEIAFGMSVEPYVKKMLFDENIKIVAPYELASVCMGVYEMYKTLLENDSLLENEENDINLFLENYEYSIRETLSDLFKKQKEINDLEEQNILYC